MADVRIGTAGWSIPLRDAQSFPGEGSSLERYSARFTCSEINSSFHRSHRPATYERWAASVPEGFRYSVKLPKAVTHKLRLKDVDEHLHIFLEEITGLGTSLAVLLVQLPPSLEFEHEVATPFFASLRRLTNSTIVCEPRHSSWFSAEVDQLLASLEVARVAADPAKAPGAAEPGGWRGIHYYRLHGSPVPYRSDYGPERLEAYAQALRADLQSGGDVWCIFDNTASSAATGNALSLQKLIEAS